MLQTVGGLYRIIAGEPEEDAGDGEVSSLLPEYCSLSDLIVMEESVRLLGLSSDAMLRISEACVGAS